MVPWLLKLIDRDGLLGKALGSTREAAASEADNPKQIYARGVLLAQQDALQEAESAYRRVLDLNASHLGAHRQLAFVLGRQGRFAEAVDFARSAVALEKDNPDSLHGLGFQLFKIGDLNGAEAVWRKAIRAAPDRAHCHRWLATVLTHQARPHEAIGVLRHAIRLDAGNLHLHYFLATLLERIGAFDEAASSFHRVIKLDPEHLGAHQRLAQVLNRQGHLNEAIDITKSAIKLAPDAPGPYHICGILLSEAGALKEAESVFRKVIEIEPDHLGAHRRLAAVLDRQGQYDDVAGVFESAAKIYRSRDRRPLRSQMSELRECTVREPAPSLSNAWAYDWLRQAEAASGLRDWHRRLEWGRDCGQLIHDMILYDRHRLPELDQLVDRSQWSDFLKRLPQGEGCMLAGAHLGPPLVAVDVLMRNNLPCKIVTSNIEFGYCLKTQNIIPDHQNTKRLLFSLLQSLRKGETVYLATEGLQGSRFRSFELRGRTIKLSLGPATLAYYAKVRTHWYAALWRDGQIVLDLRAGPKPRQSEPLDQWYERWFAFYSSCLSEAMSAGPENLYRNLNLWRAAVL